MKRVFVSHYCNIPYHLLDKPIADKVAAGGAYPKTLVADLYSVSYHLMRNFELAPFANDTKLEDLVAKLVDNDKI